MTDTLRYIFIAVIALTVFSCNDRRQVDQLSDSTSEAMLEGVWVNEDEETAVFKIVGDTLYYPDKSLLPMHFRIYRDTMYVDGGIGAKYAIEKLSDNVFQFRNQNDDVVRLVKSDDSVFQQTLSDAEDPVQDINQELLKRDTIVMGGQTRYHCYVQVNPTTYKVVKNQLSDEGIGVGKIYYDNIVHIAVYIGARRVYSRDFRKQDFSDYVDEEILSHCILSDIVYMDSGNEGVTFQAQLRIPGSASSYITDIFVSSDGEMTIRQH